MLLKKILFTINKNIKVAKGKVSGIVIEKKSVKINSETAIEFLKPIS
jgi:hypothetical protein